MLIKGSMLCSYFLKALIALHCIMLFFASSIYAQVKVQHPEDLDKAMATYSNADFLETIRIVTYCLGQHELTKSDSLRALVLRGINYAKQKDFAAAKKDIRLLLTINPKYNPEDTSPIFTFLVEETKKELAKEQEEQRLAKQSKRKKWWVAGGLGGAAAIGILIAILSGDEETSEETILPGSPGRPE